MTEQEALLYLMACGLHETVPAAETLEGVDRDRLFQLAKCHSVAGLVAHAILRMNPPDPSREIWHTHLAASVRRTMLFDAERAEILRLLDAAGIWYAPLKGIILAPMYPAYGIREMSDNDILFDASRREDVTRIMTARGYKRGKALAYAHDVYQKPPVYNFEMHRMLFSPLVNPVSAAYFDTLENRLLRDPAHPYAHRLSPADFYLHMIAHARKHYDSGGYGVRYLADIYVYLRQAGQELPREDVDAGLEQLRMTEFEQTSRELAEKLFADPMRTVAVMRTLPSRTMRTLSFMTASGAYGTMDQRVKSRTRKLGVEGRVRTGDKIRYLFKRIFLSREALVTIYPVLEHWPILYPYFVLHRVVWGLATKRKLIFSEVRELHNIRDTRDTSNTPDTSDTPDTSNTPDTSGTQDTSNTPDTSDTSDTSGTRDTQNTRDTHHPHDA